MQFVDMENYLALMPRPVDRIDFEELRDPQKVDFLKPHPRNSVKTNFWGPIYGLKVDLLADLGCVPSPAPPGYGTAYGPFPCSH